MPKRKPNPGHLAKVKSTPCIICGANPPSDAHHIKTRPDGQTYGMSQKAPDEETIPLCKAHHQHGPDAFHNGPKSFRSKYGSERELLAKTLDLLDLDQA